MSVPKMRFGLVGAGAIAQTWCQAFEHSHTAQLVGIVDVRDEVATAVAERMKCKPFASPADLVDELHPDSVVLCTPPSTHPELCTWFLARGINVLCEKPLAVGLDEARVMLDAAEQSDALLTMASKFRYVSDVVQAKSIVSSGLIGDLILFENAFTSRVDMTHRWNADPEVSGGGVLIDNGTHSVDLLRYFLGPIVELQVIEGKRVQDIPVEDTVKMYIRSQGGVMGSIDLSWSLNKELPNYLSIYGSQGTVHVGWKESKYRRAGDEKWTVFGKGYDKFQAFGSQLDNFVKAARGEEAPLITLADALASVEVIEAGYDAMWRASWVPVENHLSGAFGKAS
ncbi:MAG: Gfo/Idh/MocA family protein [Pirellulaceae bacterium]